MAINSWEVINLVIAVLIIIGMLISDKKTILFLLAIYGSLHFSYAIEPLFTGVPVKSIGSSQ